MTAAADSFVCFRFLFLFLSLSRSTATRPSREFYMSRIGIRMLIGQVVVAISWCAASSGFPSPADNQRRDESSSPSR